jgi:hypothetical protein
MNLQIYKWTAHPDCYNAGTIYYAIRDLDLPEHNPCITISLHRDSWSLYTQKFPIDSGNVYNDRCAKDPDRPPKISESSFMDLVLTTGIIQSQIEYIFTNIDFDSHTISIQPRASVESWGSQSTTNTSSSSKNITLCSSFGHAKSINI